jgi:hypothetical protein
MKAVRQLSKNTAIQMNANRPRRRRARVVAELQKEKDSDLREHRTEFLVSLITITEIITHDCIGTCAGALQGCV